MEEELLNLIGEYLVDSIKKQIKTPEARFTKRGNMPKNPSRYNFYATGSLYNSVSYVLRDGEIDILMNDYGIDYVFGEGSWPKGTKKSGGEFIRSLETWVRAKIGLSGAEAKSMAYAVRKNLFKSGYKGYNLFTEEFQENTGKYVDRLLDQPQYQEAVLGNIFDRINIFGIQTYNIAIS
jgi:hypothetical protein